ncbi:hypothetical protein OGR47_05605 [Methylocystis sp. MJC1]|jgi:hypothetical protein|uniref:hypothetical protein n=1 Tax=Methylocystis sp. MJC1 TaxID=2654282 RepID=UPI0013EA3E76|nr:hypothetical protein [Methylocystis sp. MJC1]KAF2992502.1 hypothetical protein MJC1_00079 [Methylocystis sp. MJC1]MBU6526479.1 hypothetical protein [Methylocystis sp. MJC1]UZX12919.1 hypothetical protein OGR47_05605 [Methylocystis sp. MJC1]
MGGTLIERPPAPENAQLYSEELGIRIERICDRELFKWFIASLLFGARVTPIIAKQGYFALARNKLLTPRQISNAGEKEIYELLLQAGYVRSAKAKSSQLVKASQRLLDMYGGSLEKLHDAAESPRHLEALLRGFPGVGPVTANIFLRELRPFWPKADPAPLERVIDHARAQGVDLNATPRKNLDFVKLETGLVRELAKTGESRKFAHAGGGPSKRKAT